jgi:hypothetical protein
MTGRSGRRAVRASRVGSRPLRPGAGTSRRAVRAVSCWRWNGGFGAHSGPSSGDPRRRASRPEETSTVASRNVRFSSTGAVCGVGIERGVLAAFLGLDATVIFVSGDFCLTRAHRFLSLVTLLQRSKAAFNFDRRNCPTYHIKHDGRHFFGG